MRVEGHRAKDGESMEIENNLVTPGYWKTMGAAVVEGRVFDERDRFDPSEGDKLVNIAVVNRSFARRFFGDESAVGKRIGAGPQAEQMSIRIVGVVEDSLYAGPRQGSRPVVYFPFWQANFPIQASFYVRISASTEATFPALRRIVARLDSSLPIYEMKTLERQLDDTLSAERLIATLSIVFGFLAAVIAALGLYGVLAFIVAKRAKEIGLRMALGAGGWSVVGLVLREIAVVVAAGLVIGLPLALLASRFVSSQLYGVTAADAATFASAAAIIVLIAAASGAAPARRASTIDPLAVLRSD
jgi:predicted permease